MTRGSDLLGATEAPARLLALVGRRLTLGIGAPQGLLFYLQGSDEIDLRYSAFGAAVVVVPACMLVLKEGAINARLEDSLAGGLQVAEPTYGRLATAALAGNCGAGG